MVGGGSLYSGCPFCQQLPSPRQYTRQTLAQAAPVLRKTTAPATSEKQTAEPLLADGRGASSPGGSKGLVAGGSGRGDGEAAGASAAGEAKNSLLSEAVVRGLAYGMVNGILLPPVLVRVQQGGSAVCRVETVNGGRRCR